MISTTTSTLVTPPEPEIDKILQNLQRERVSAFKEFKSEVKRNKFPTKKHSILLEKKELLNFKKFLKTKKANN